MAKLTVSRKLKSGKTIRYKTPDKGAKGRTPNSKRFFTVKVHSGWSKDMPMDKRRRLALKAHKSDTLATARGLNQLANVTTDKETSTKARADAKYFFNKYRSK